MFHLIYNLFLVLVGLFLSFIALDYLGWIAWAVCIIGVIICFNDAFK